MVALAGVVGRQIAVGPQAETDWLVIPNLWGLLVGRPGLLKSPAMEAMLTPLKRLAQEAAEDFVATQAEHEAALAGAQAAPRGDGKGRAAETVQRSQRRYQQRAAVAATGTTEPEALHQQ